MTPTDFKNASTTAGPPTLGWLLSRRVVYGVWFSFGLMLVVTLAAFALFKDQTDERLAVHFGHRQLEIQQALTERLSDIEFFLRARQAINDADVDDEQSTADDALSSRGIYPEVADSGYATLKDNHLHLLGGKQGNALSVALSPANRQALKETAKSGHAHLSPLPRAAAVSGCNNCLLMVMPASRDAAVEGFIFALIDAQQIGEYVMSTLSWKDVRFGLRAAEGALLYDSEAAVMPAPPKAHKEFTANGMKFSADFTPQPRFGSRLGESEYIWVVLAGGLCGFAVLGFYLVASGYMRSLSLGRDLDTSWQKNKFNENLLQAFLNDAPVSVAMFDKDIRYLLCSERWKRDVGFEGQDIIGRCHYDMFPNYLAENPNARIRVRQILMGENVTEEKIKMVRNDGSWDYVRYEARPWRNLQGEVEGIITFRDIITEKVKSHDELQRYAREVEQFAYIASHDLKAPLRGVDNLAKWIMEDMEPVMTPEVRESFKVLRNRVRRLETMLEDILRYSKAGHVVETPKPVDTAELIDSITRLNPWGENFDIHCEGAMPVLLSPRTPLEQVFTNLIANAVKHHDKDAGKIVIKAIDRGTQWEFIVQDDGPGIPPVFHERVFGLFQTLKPRDQREGSGLGMSIIKKLIEWQNGRVWIVSKENERGTAVHFEWNKEFQERMVHAA